MVWPPWHFLLCFILGKVSQPSRARQHRVTLTEPFKHLIKFAERLPGGKYRWTFASYPIFPYWALDMKQRHQLLSQVNIYLHQHPTDVSMTMEELMEMVSSTSGKQMVNRVECYVSKLQGTNHEHSMQ